MSLLEQYVKEAFIEIYFKDGNYLQIMHNHIINQIKSYNYEIVSENAPQLYPACASDPAEASSTSSDSTSEQMIDGIKDSISEGSGATAKNKVKKLAPAKEINEYIIIQGEKIQIPKIPEYFTSDTLMAKFVKGILNSKYFIS